MDFASDDSPRFSFSPSEYHPAASSANFMTFSSGDTLHDDTQYCLSGSEFTPSRYQNVETPSGEIPGATSHPTSSLGPETTPWTHLAATQGRISPLPEDFRTDLPTKPQNLTTPTRGRPRSTASGEGSFGDSAYWTGAKSHHEVDSVTESTEEQMEQGSQNPPLPLFDPAQAGTYPSSRSSSTVTPAMYAGDPIPPTNTQPGANSQGEHHHKGNSDLYCEECHFTGKTRSDMKKHNARHERKYRCRFIGCSRQKKGFATSNDLDRHLKSVHSVNNRKTKYYKCFAQGCTKASKMWPRQDNFRQHLVKMHKGDDEGRLMMMSEQWYEHHRQQPQAEGLPEDETQSQDATDDMAIDFSTMPAPHDLAPYNYTDSNQSYTSGSPFGNAMTRTQSSDPSNPNPRPSHSRHLGTVSHKIQRRRVSTPENPSDLRRQSRTPRISTQSLVPPRTAFSRTRSQADQSLHVDDTQASNHGNPFIGIVSIPDQTWPDIQHPFSGMKMDYSLKYAWENDQITKVRGPYTVANPFLDTNRMAELPSPREVQPSMLHDLRGQQEDIIMNADGGTTAEAVTPISPYRCPQVNVIPPEGERPPSTTRLTKRLVDEVANILSEHKTLSGKAGSSFSEEELLLCFRTSLRSSVGSVESSSLGLITGEEDSENTAVKKCPATNQVYHICRQCGKIKSRASELKKHMQRHAKPFGCTFDGCNKIFGSKNDWKRHEQGQHEQQECWRCLECQEVFYHDQSYYVRHVSQVHATDPVKTTAHAPLERKIARNYQGRFWCGFCDQIIVHNLQGVEAITLRFNHISDHFMKDKKSIKTWIEVGGQGRTKGKRVEECAESTLDAVQAEEEEDGTTYQPRLESNSTESSYPQSESSLDEQMSFSPSSSAMLDSSGLQQQFTFDHPHPTAMTLADHMMLFSGQHQVQADDSIDNRGASWSTGSPRRDDSETLLRHNVIVKCCQCKCTSSWDLNKSCLNCQHDFCDSRCKYRLPEVE
ncbi:hypothetical protein LTR96_003454 [Exophiala xenobiotica]|nr:hypothetical protein LTR96_003454 [Exophiala xenobiotica]KAK5342865.1 hypothetical protein LTR98_000491 [Exophiala xenobiotica]